MIRPSQRRVPPASEAARPLLVTSDERLLDDLLRLAAAAGVEVEVVDDPAAARGRWSPVPLVVVGSDQAAGLAALAPVRRHGVLVVGHELDDSELWRHGVALGAEHVLIFPEDESWLADRFADAAEGDAVDATVLGIVGGRGGAGASVFATATALAAARRGHPTTLVDLDALGGGLDLVLGAEHDSGLRWPDLAASRGRLNGRQLREELPGRDGLSLVSCDRRDPPTMPAHAVTAVLAASRRACEVMVLDLPRYLDPPAEDALGTCTCALIVVPAEVRAVAAASRIAPVLTTLCPDVRLVVRGPSASGLDGREVARALGLPLAAEMAAEPGLLEALDRGEPPGLNPKSPIALACADVLDLVLPEGPAERPARVA